MSGTETSPAPTAVAVAGGRILYVGDDRSALALAGDGARVIDLKGGVVIPGFIDSHCHLYGLGKSLAEIDLRGTTSPAQIIGRVAAAAPGEGWIEGRSWDQNDWAVKEYPDRALLDAVTGDAAGAAAARRRPRGLGQHRGAAPGRRHRGHARPGRRTHHPRRARRADRHPGGQRGQPGRCDHPRTGCRRSAPPTRTGRCALPASGGHQRARRRHLLEARPGHARDGRRRHPGRARLRHVRRLTRSAGPGAGGRPRRDRTTAC